MVNKKVAEEKVGREQGMNLFEAEEKQDVEETLKNLGFLLVNQKHKIASVEAVVKVPVLDLCFVFMVFEREGKCRGVTFDKMHQLGLSMEELQKLAFANMQKKYPYIGFQNLWSVLQESLSQECIWEVESQLSDSLEAGYAVKNVYVITNEVKCFGASVLFYPGVMEQIAEEKKSSFYMIPSSIHEWLICFDDEKSDHTARELKQILLEVNRTEVEEKDWLSDNLYYYDRELGQCCIVPVLMNGSE